MIWAFVTIPLIGSRDELKVFVIGDDEEDVRRKANICAIVTVGASSGARRLSYKGVL